MVCWQFRPGRTPEGKGGYTGWQGIPSLQRTSRNQVNKRAQEADPEENPN